MSTLSFLEPGKRRHLGVIGLTALVAACSDSATVIDASAPPAGDPAMDTVDNGSGEPQQAVYALHTGLSQPDGSNLGYVALMPTLDVSGQLSLAGAREFPGYAFITSVNGKLLVSDGEAPIVTQFDVSDQLDWIQNATLSFAGVGSFPFGASFERHWFLNEHVAYLTSDVTRRIVWDPTDFVIRGVMDDTTLEAQREGLVLDAAFNRPPRMPQGPVVKLYYYRDEDWFRFGPETPVAIFDPDTHEEAYIVDVPCPALEVSSQDEAGNTYLSPWTYGPALGLFGEGPATCIRRLNSESRLHTDWAPDLRDWTAGRPVQVFRYLKDGKALGTVLHVDEVEGDFAAGYDPDLAEELGSHWRLWLFDLEQETAQPIQGIGATSSSFSMDSVDDRTFVFVPKEDYSETTVYELDLQGEATARFTVEGLVSRLIRLR
jgi:hypothetical protein